VRAVAEAHGVTPAQAILRWHLQRGHIVIPKSATPGRIVENLSVDHFELGAAELEAIDGLESGSRIGGDPRHVLVQAYEVTDDREGGLARAAADLAAGDAAGCIVATFSADNQRRRNRIPALAARSPTAVGADVETGPIIDCGDHRGRLGVRTRRQVGS